MLAERESCTISPYVYEGYTSLVRAQASSYRDRLTDVVWDAQLRGEYLGVNRAHNGENSLCPHRSDANRDGERGVTLVQPKAMVMSSRFPTA